MKKLIILATLSALIVLGNWSGNRIASAPMRAIASVSSLAIANLHTDLRTELIGYGHLLKHNENSEIEKNCTIIKTDGDYKLWRCAIGEIWMPKNEDVSGIGEMAEIITGDTYMYHGRTVRPGDVVIDCGAHLGSFIRKSLQKGASLVIGIEPSSTKVECMKRTFATEIAAGKVRILQVAVWDKDDKLWLPGDPDMGNSLIDQSESKKKQKGEWVKVTTLDKIIAEEKLEKLDFLKMDIEGAESNALKGAAENIKRFRPFLAIATEHTDDLTANSRNVIAIVDSFNLGYQRGFGRYGKLKQWNSYTPFEVFFFQEKL